LKFWTKDLADGSECPANHVFMNL